MEAKLKFTPDSSFIVIEVTHRVEDSTTAIFNYAANFLNESRFYDFCITEVEWKKGIARFMCEA